MKLRFKTVLALCFTLIGLVSIVIVSLVVNFFFESAFQEYAKQKQEKRNQDIIQLIESQYMGDQVWNNEVIQDIGVTVLEEGLLLKLTDNDGTTIWDAVEYNSGICLAMVKKMTDRMTKHYPLINGGFTLKGYPVRVKEEQVGILHIGYYGPFYYSDTEIFFIETLNRLLIWVAAGTFIIAILAGFFISRIISKPLSLVIASAKKLAAGDYSIRCPVTSKTVEVHDLITSVNHLAETLNVQDTLRKQLTADVAHELRTPLSTLRGYIEAFSDGVWKPTKERFLSCHEEILRLTKLVEDITTLAHFESEKLTLKKTHFCIKDVINRVFLFFESGIKEKHITTSLDSREVMIYADEDKIKQVIMNLLSNAIKFTPPGGSIGVRVFKENDMVVFTVSDTGQGIPAEDIPFIFERFYRVDKSRTRSTGGTGIGLSIAKQIVTSHKGTISVQSSPGKGSVFTVRLPAHNSSVSL